MAMHKATEKGLSDSDKKDILSYLAELKDIQEDNERTIKDYIENDEGEPDDMTPEEKYEYDKNQRQEDYNRIVNLISKK